MVSDFDPAREHDADRERVGLCADCVHARRIESSRGSFFYMCLRAEREPAFRKYPTLPVRKCEGYER
jgi:hypothetical protein